MIREFKTVSLSTPIIEVAHQMKLTGRGTIIVCDNNCLQGVVTERDIVAKVVAGALDPVTEPASSVMNKRVPAVSPCASVVLAAKVMADSGVLALPVVQDGKVVGLLTAEVLAQVGPALAAMVIRNATGVRASALSRRFGRARSALQGSA